MAGLEAGLGLWEEVVDEEAEVAVLPTTDEGTSTPSILRKPYLPLTRTLIEP